MAGVQSVCSTTSLSRLSKASNMQTGVSQRHRSEDDLLTNENYLVLNPASTARSFTISLMNECGCDYDV